MTEDSRSRDRFQVGLDRGNPCLQVASSSSAPHARQCGKEKVLDKLTFGTSCGMSKPAEPSLHEQFRYACKATASSRVANSTNMKEPFYVDLVNTDGIFGLTETFTTSAKPT